MIWAAPEWLLALAAPAAVALALLLFSFVRRRDASLRWPRISRVLASAGGLQSVPAKRTIRRPWLVLAAATLCIAALARPQWGEVEEDVVEQAREVMIALDLSRSMLVNDVSPTRLDRARLLVRSLLDGLEGERVGLIVFAGTAFVQVPLSADYEILNEFLPELTPDYMPQGGTDYDGMLQSALEAFGSAADADRFLIVLSDGESTYEGWRDNMDELQERKVRVIALGVGTPDGGLVPDPKSGYIKDERGAVVLSRLESATLQELAATTRGAYRNASVWVDLPALLNETVALGQLQSFEEQRRVRRLERFQWFVAPAALLALLGIWREFAVRPAARSVPVRPSAAGGRRAARAVSMAVLIAPALLLNPERTQAAEAAEPSAAEQAIRETVTRLIANRQPTAADWRELAEQTVAFGAERKAGQQPVPPGPVTDALAAVERGEQLDPDETDWAQLRQDLEDLLESESPPPQQQEPPEPEDQPPEEAQEQQQQANTDPGSSDQSEQDSSDQDQQSSDNQQSGEPTESENSPAGEDQSGSESQSPQQQPQQSNEAPSPPQGGNTAPEGSELGELAPPENREDSSSPPQRKPRETETPTKKIGGRRAGKPAEDLDPKQTAALQELRSVQKRDAPARLFELLEGEPADADAGPDW